MKRVYHIVFSVLLASGSAVAQENQGAKTLTLDECIQYALDNSIAVKNAVLDEQIADARVKETRGIGLPQIDATVGLLHNQKLPRFFAQYNPEGGESFFDLSGIPGIEPGDVVAFPNFFQLGSSGNAS